MLEKEKDDILKENYLVRKRRAFRDERKYRGDKNRYFLIAVIICLLIMTFMYLSSDRSKVFRVSVSGNRYLDDDYYRDLAGIDDNTIYYLTLDGSIESRIADDPLVRNVTVEHRDNRVINIEVEEKKIIAYVYDDEPYLIDEDGERIMMTSDYYDLISMVPIIEGYTIDEIKEIARGFKNVDDEMIEEISEIHKYPFSYDERMMEVIMRSGNYVYVSYYGLSLLNNYHSIEASLTSEEDHVCIFLDEVTNSGYTSACPYWQKEEKPSDENETTDNTQEGTEAKPAGGE